MKYSILTALCGFSLLIASFFPISPANAAPAERHVRLALLVDHTPVEPGETVRVALSQVIESGWHTYWRNPGDSGQPMHVKWTLPPGFTMSDPEWPVPGVIKTGPLVSYGYKDKAVILQTLTVPKTLPPGPLVLSVKTETLVCASICIPEFDTLSLRLNNISKADLSAAEQALPDKIVIKAEFALSHDGRFLNLRVRTRDAADLANAVFIPADWGIIKNDGRTQRHIEDGLASFRLERGDRPFNNVKTLYGLIAYKDRTGHDRGLTIEAVPGVVADTEPFLFLFGRAVLYALLGGLILNLMPCVFPVLSMKALSLIKMTGKERAHAQVYGLAYALGILVCFTLIAGTLMALKMGGAQIGWGFQLQNPLVVLLLSWLLFVIGLNFSGLYEISGGLTNIGAGLTRHEGLKGSFFTGMLAALVATPCTAPFMGTAMGYALTQDPPVALAVFLALGTGLALPYLLICFVPALQRLLPRPGHWMQTLREFLAFPMYASAAWLVWVYASQIGLNGIGIALTGMILLAMIFWLAARAPKHGIARAVVFVFGFCLVAGLAGLAWTAKSKPLLFPPAARTAIPGEAEAFSTQRFNEALKGSEPLFVNMTAAWCITCKINENVALRSAEVKALFAAKGVRYLKGDWTNQDPDITAFLERYGRNGVPLYVYYGPRNAKGERPEAVILPQILTPAIVRDHIQL